MSSISPMDTRRDDIVVVGSGMAGLVCALSLAPRPVTLITKTASLAGGSSFCAKGGIAAAVGPGDSAEAHAEDTLTAGAGLGDAERAFDLTRDGADALKFLIGAGVPFDRALDGTLALAHEAAHRRPRIVHAGGDASGRIMMAALIARVRATPSIRVLESTFVHDLLLVDGRVRGLLAYDQEGRLIRRFTSHVVLATGGIGVAWWHTTNPAEATGDGLAMAARAGAELADLEFVQFHPTALVTDDADGSSLPLLTEALRGAGALLVDAVGDRIMTSRHAHAELAPRDVVAREIQRRLEAGDRTFLDLRPVLASGRGGEFPEAVAASRNAGFDPEDEPLPVVPAAHYHMGGIRIDVDGRTSVRGLWASGEVATTGIHGANRLASNSLLEAVVYARRVAAGILASRSEGPEGAGGCPAPAAPHMPGESSAGYVAAIVRQARRTMSENAGVLRDGSGLRHAITRLADLERDLDALCDRNRAARRQVPGVVRAWGEARNRLLVSRLVALAAVEREESRGAHYRDDFPNPAAGWLRRQSLTLARLRQTPAVAEARRGSPTS